MKEACDPRSGMPARVDAVIIDSSNAGAKSLMTMPKNANDHPRGLLIPHSYCVFVLRFRTDFACRPLSSSPFNHEEDPPIFIDSTEFNLNVEKFEIIQLFIRNSGFG